jgi:hypothetical protein
MRLSTWVLVWGLAQFAVMEQWLPSCISPFDKTHEDLLWFLSQMTYFIIRAIEDKKLSAITRHELH